MPLEFQKGNLKSFIKNTELIFLFNRQQSKAASSPYFNKYLISFIHNFSRHFSGLAYRYKTILIIAMVSTFIHALHFLVVHFPRINLNPCVVFRVSSSATIVLSFQINTSHFYLHFSTHIYYYYYYYYYWCCYCYCYYQFFFLLWRIRPLTSF
jgi:hypothetical protein